MTQEEQLINIYKAAYSRLMGEVAKGIGKIERLDYISRIIPQIVNEIERLNKASKKYIENEIPKVVNAVYTKEMARLKVESINIAINKPLIQRLQRELWETLFKANNTIQSNIRQKMNEVAVSYNIDKNLGMTKQDALQNASDEMLYSGFQSFTDSAGKEWNIVSYAEMAIKTKRTIAVNETVMHTANVLGSDLVKMSSHASTCPVCALYENRVYSISGKDERFPKLSEAFNKGYSTIHPNCRHRLLVYIEDMENVKQDIKSSNRPFEDMRSEREKQLYIDRQEKKARTRTKERLEYTIAALNKTPKSDERDMEILRLKNKLKKI